MYWILFFISVILFFLDLSMIVGAGWALALFNFIILCCSCIPLAEYRIYGNK